MKKNSRPRKLKRLAKKIGIDFNKLDLGQFRMGLRVELERDSHFGVT